jgi:hypothetical protein
MESRVAWYMSAIPLISALNPNSCRNRKKGCLLNSHFVNIHLPAALIRYFSGQGSIPRILTFISPFL